MSEQQVSVTVLPGKIEVTLIHDYMLVTDLRGIDSGWRIVLKDARVTGLESVLDGSAPGIHFKDDLVSKDAQVGPGDSTGGQWLFTLDRTGVVGVELTIGKHTVFWVVPTKEGFTRKFDHDWFRYEL